MAIFPMSAACAAELIPGEEIHPFRLGGDVGLLVLTVVNYETTDIGSYIEFSIAIACTHGLRPAPPLVGALLPRYGVGQFVVDLPVSTEISVKGGKGIWGMPKHQANLDFVIREDRVWSQYDLDGQLCCRIEIDRPAWTGLPVSMPAVNYCAFRGMLNKSSIYFRGRAGFKVPLTPTARLTLGEHPRMAALHRLRVARAATVRRVLPEHARDPRRPHGELVPHVPQATNPSARGTRERRRPRPGSGVASASGAVTALASLRQRTGCASFIAPAPARNVRCKSPACPGLGAGPSTTAAFENRVK